MVFIMLYPKIMNIRKTNIAIKILLIISLVVSAICILINELTTPHIKWSALVIIVIIYSWLTTLYSVKKNRNIGTHIILQTVAISILIILIDIIIGFKAWSITIALPIIIAISNITMTVLTIVNRKKYFKYSISQIILSMLNILFILLIVFEVTQNKISILVSVCVSIVAFIISICLCGKDLKEEVSRMFHI